MAHCELAAYPKPAAGDIKDDCAGTGLGYLGGTALLTPDKATYGECRSGVTQMEATYGPKGSKSGPLSELPVLADGAEPGTERAALLRLQPRRGVRKRVRRRRPSSSPGIITKLISKAAETAAPAPSEAPKTP